MPNFDWIENEEDRAKAIAEADAEKAELTTSLTNAMDSKIAEAVDKLKNKNDELISEKRAVQEKLQAFEGLDAEEVQKAMDAAKKAADEALTAEERAAKAISDLRNDHSSALEELQSKLEAATGQSSEFKARYDQKIVEDTLRQAAIASGVLPEALDAVVREGSILFKRSDSDEVEARDAENQLKKNKDGIIITPKVFFEDLKSTSSFYWPTSQSGNFNAAKGADNSEILTKIDDAISSGNMARAKKLRASMKK